MEKRRFFIVDWIMGSLVGYIAGLTVVIAIFALWEIFNIIAWENFRDTDWYNQRSFKDFLFSALMFSSLFLMGVPLGFAQWKAGLQGKINKWAWILASAAAGLIGIVMLINSIQLSPAMLSVQSGTHSSGLDQYYQISNTWIFGAIIGGSLTGISASFPQWIVLAYFFQRSFTWFLSAAIGGIVAFVTFTGIAAIVKNFMIASPIACCISPLIFQAILGMGLYSILKYPKKNTSKTDLP